MKLGTYAMNVLAVKELLYPTLPPWKAEPGAVSRLLAVKLPVSNVLHIETLDKPPLLSAVRRAFYAGHTTGEIRSTCGPSRHAPELRAIWQSALICLDWTICLDRTISMFVICWTVFAHSDTG
jgi:hypothetical protein